MENFFEREVKRLAFVEERMKIREQEKRQLDAEESKRQQVSRPCSHSVTWLLAVRGEWKRFPFVWKKNNCSVVESNGTVLSTGILGNKRVSHQGASCVSVMKQTVQSYPSHFGNFFFFTHARIFSPSQGLVVVYTGKVNYFLSFRHFDHVVSVKPET